MKLKELLKSKKIRQSHLAKLLDVSNQLITKWIQGKCEPQLEMLPRLGKVLDLSVDEVVKLFAKN